MHCLMQEATDKTSIYIDRGIKACFYAVAVLSRALPGKRYVALFLGSAINQDGRSSGLTAPNGPSQTTLIREATANASMHSDVARLGLVAVHGTGTPLGDPIEMGALGNAFARQPGTVVLSSVKASYGHTEGAAGLTGQLSRLIGSL